MEIDADFHIHSRYSAATSQNMNLKDITTQGKLKGLELIGTGDALHSGWLEELKGLKNYTDGIYKSGEMKYIFTVEVEDFRRVHHLIILPGFSAARALKESIKKYAFDLDTDGRPHLRMNGEELADYVGDVDGLVGPSHAFVPWTSIYKEYDSLKECYKKNAPKINFLELGLSADTEMADHIEELAGITYMSNSDAHSPWPNKLGREFNRLKVEDINFTEIKKAILRKGKNRFTLNVGFDPRLGKYHRSACIKCHSLFKFKDAVNFVWKCPGCGGKIKKGVFDRVEEISNYSGPRSPNHRPPYIRIAPLSEILTQALGIKNAYSGKVQGLWKKLVENFGSEISVLIDASPEEIAKVGGNKLATLITSFRRGNFNIIEGGGGKYGEIVFNRNSVEEKFYNDSQLSLDSF